MLCAKLGKYRIKLLGMKKLFTFITTILIIFTSTALFAQQNEVVIKTVQPEKKSRKLSFGLFGGSNLAWIRSDTKGYNGDGVRLGLNYGLVTDFSLANNDNYFLSTGLVISNIGGKMDNPSAFTLEDTAGAPYLVPSRVGVTYSVRQLEIPISLKMKTAEIGYIKYFGQFGISPGYALRVTREGNEAYTGGTEAIEESSASDYLSIFRLGVLAGAGVEYNLTGNTNLMIGLSYNGAFTNILKGQEAGSDKRRAFEVDDNGTTDVSKVQIGAEPYKVSSGPELISRSDFVSLNIAIFF